MNKLKLCSLAIPMLLSANAFASSEDFINPFVNMDTEIVDISHDYVQGKINIGEDFKSLSLAGSKSLNRMMFVDIDATYVFDGDTEGRAAELGFGLNYPLPIPVDVMVMDLYAKGFASYASVSGSDFNAKMPSLGAIGGIKSNFGSDMVFINLYGGMEFMDLEELKDEPETKEQLMYGAEMEFIVGRQTSLIVGGEYRHDQYSFNTALRYSF